MAKQNHHTRILVNDLQLPFLVVVGSSAAATSPHTQTSSNELLQDAAEAHTHHHSQQQQQQSPATACQQTAQLAMSLHSQGVCSPGSYTRSAAGAAAAGRPSTAAAVAVSARGHRAGMPHHPAVRSSAILWHINFPPKAASTHMLSPCPTNQPNTPNRRGELSSLAPYLPIDSLAQQGAPVILASVPVHEQGPLARCAPFMDTAARRVLPGHLLRRARVLSSFQVGRTHHITRRSLAAGQTPCSCQTHSKYCSCLHRSCDDNIQHNASCWQERNNNCGTTSCT